MDPRRDACVYILLWTEVHADGQRARVANGGVSGTPSTDAVSRTWYRDRFRTYYKCISGDPQATVTVSLEGVGVHPASAAPLACLPHSAWVYAPSSSGYTAAPLR